MKSISIVCMPIIVILMVCLGWTVSCSRQNSFTAAQEKPVENVTPPSWIYDRLDPVMREMIASLQASAWCNTFLADTRRIGKPYWAKSLSGERGATKIFLVPLKNDRDSLFSTFVAIETDTALRYKVFTEGEWPADPNTAAGPAPSAFDINHALNALNHFAFGKRVYTTTGLPLSALNRLDRLIASSESQHPSKRSPIIVTSCYHWSTCMGDGKGNCVGNEYHFTECVSQVIWTPTAGNHGTPAPSPEGGGGPGVSGGGGGGATSPSNPAPPPATLPIPQKPITNVNRHLECFNSTLSAKVTIYVDQPTPGTTEPVSILGGIGHTFLSFEQQQNGKLVRRTIGFYAQTPIDPVKKKSAASMLGDDAGRKYDVKWETFVSGDQLSEMLQGTIHYAGTYHIEDYNCVNFVLDIFDMGGVRLPRTEGWWITGRGLNPGTLGEDIRQLPGSVGMKGNGPDNTGTCQPPKVFF